MNTFKRLFSIMKDYKIFLSLAFIFAIISVFLQLYIPLLTGNAIDHMLGFQAVDFKAINNIILKMIICVICGSISSYFMIYIINEITFKSVSNLRTITFAKLSKVNISYIDQNSHGNIISIIINDIDLTSDGITQTFTTFLTGIITIVMTIGFMLYYEWTIALLVIALTPLSMICASIIAKSTFKTFKKQAEMKGELSSVLEESLDNLKKIAIFENKEGIIKKYNNLNNDLHVIGFKAQFLSSFINPITRLINALIYAMVGIYGAYLCVTKDVLTAGLLTAFLTYAHQYTKPFNEISNVIAELQNSLSSAKRVFGLLDELEMSDESNLEVNDKLDGQISFKNLAFSYNSDKEIIKNFTTDVKQGEKIALVGATGCGKSTIINILMKFYEYNKGSITIDGIELKNIKREDIRKNIGIVLQDSWLFKGTIQENLLYGLEDATMNQIIEACKKVQAHDFIIRLKDGYDTLIDDSSLSSGEKQLLCIVRLMLKAPKILVLDEATSNIDTRTEIKVSNAFALLMENKTSFIIAHRLKTIESVDKIAVIYDGEIKEIGTHKELLDQNSYYKQIYDAQFA